MKKPVIFLEPRYNVEDLPQDIAIEQLKEEALRLVLETDKMWNPATKNGKPFTTKKVVSVHWTSH